MAYQNVKTPRFYIDHISWYKAMGIGSGIDLRNNIAYGLNPTNQETFADSDQEYIKFEFNENVTVDFNFWGILGHNMSGDMYVNPFCVAPDDTQIYFSNNSTAGDGIANANITQGASTTFDLTGFSLAKLINNGESFSHEINAIGFPFGQETTVGSCVVGKYYDMPHSPDLSLSMSHSYEGIKTIQTKGGSTLSNANYHKPPKWGDLEAWQLGGWQQLSSGRRSWELSFSYISDTDLEPRNYTGLKTDGEINDDNWFQNVLYYTMGGHLPFIFQPDKEATYNSATYTVPEFAICRFDMDSFQREQVANNVYNIKVKIIESW